MASYDVRKYWNEVADELKERADADSAVVAGDDEPYYTYKRNLFIQKLLSLSLNSKSVLEVGCGPGGNLKVIQDNFQVSKLSGCDISESMLALSKSNLSDKVDLFQIDGKDIPKDKDVYDVVFTSTVLQHIVDPIMLEPLINSITKVSGDKVYLFERIEKTIKGHDSNQGRPVSYYSSLFEEGGFELVNHEFIFTGVSRVVSGVIRKLFNSVGRKEGQQQSAIARGLQKFALIFTKPLDKLIRWDSGLCMLEFRKKRA